MDALVVVIPAAGLLIGLMGLWATHRRVQVARRIQYQLDALASGLRVRGVDLDGGPVPAALRAIDEARASAGA